MPHIISGSITLVFLFKALPIPSPKGSIDIPEPTVKKLIKLTFYPFNYTTKALIGQLF